MCKVPGMLGAYKFQTKFYFKKFPHLSLFFPSMLSLAKNEIHLEKSNMMPDLKCSSRPGEDYIWFKITAPASRVLG